ncbi:MAG: 2-oxoacid:acceptor oxidoreductase family protein [Candidatus Latescibacteria bacterium]|nr:2-oxoacid:acceptor oxidoreductase family protein [Candidatus Latescibacterota bacterium]
MSKMIEVRWHGRGGQGAKTAAYLLAESAMQEGKYIQAFPEYGPERMGAPMMAFTRISDNPIRIHCHVKTPQVVAVLDPTLLETVDILDGVPKDGTVVVNTAESPDSLRRTLSISGRRLFTVPATQIALETIGKPIPNTPMIGAMIKASGLLNIEAVITNTRKSFEKKFSGLVVEKNIQAIRRAYEEVKSE